MRYMKRRIAISDTDRALLRRLIKDAQESATLKRAAFSQELKETVDLHHRSWIIHPLQVALDFLEGKTTRQQCMSRETSPEGDPG